MDHLIINEIFHSIQGESSWAGLPCVFVRLTGCPLRCRWCDTAYAHDQGDRMGLAEIIRRVRAHDCPLVEVTGGEPLAQPAAPALLRMLCKAGFTVLLETSGALDISQAPPGVHVIMDVKCPSSGMSERMRWENLAALKPGDEVKFVLADRRDYEYARRVIGERLAHTPAGLLVSTATGRLEPRQAVEWVLGDRLPVRFQLQMHKYIWPPETQGV